MIHEFGEPKTLSWDSENSSHKLLKDYTTVFFLHILAHLQQVTLF